MTKSQINNLPYLKEKRKALRNNLTTAEAILWNHLKGSQLEDRKFRRQHSINHYILDFYCPSEKLAIELDGAYHFTEEGQQKDQKRDADLMELGVRVIRFENNEVLEHLEGVLEKIKGCFRNHP